MNRRLMIAMCAAILWASPPAAFAHEGHDHKVMGTLTQAAADHVRVKTKDGKEVTIQVTTATRVVRGQQPVKLAEVEPGTRVVVTAISEKQQMRAKLIQVAAAPAPASK